MDIDHLLGYCIIFIFPNTFDSFGVFGYFCDPGLDSPFVAFGSLCKPGLFLGFYNYFFFSDGVITEKKLDPVLPDSVE